MSFFNLLLGNITGEAPDPLPEGDFFKFYETSVKNSDNQTYKDTEQVANPCFIETANSYYMFYNANSQNVLATIYQDIDLIFLAIKSKTDGLPIYQGWEKYSDANGPISLLSLDAESAWDGSNQYLRKVIDMGDGTYRMYYNGLADGIVDYDLGYATSSDLLTWTKYPSNPILSDNTPIFVPYKDGVDWYAITKIGAQFKVYTSNNGIAWTFTRNITLSNATQIMEIFKFGSTFYCYGYDLTLENLICYSTDDFITFTYLGNSLAVLKESTEYLIHPGMLQTGTYSFALFYSYGKYHYRQERVGVKNGNYSIRCATLTNSIPWKTTFRKIWPSYVKKFYSICNSNFSQLISGTAAINQPASPSYSTDELYLQLNGTTDYVEFPEAATLPSNLDYSLKMRVYKNLTGVQPLFTYTNGCIYVGLNSGKLEVKLKNSVGTLVKHYVSVDNVDTPATARDVYTGAWIGFIFQDSTLKLYINNVEVSTTKTIDSTIDSIYNQSSNNVIIGKLSSTLSNCSIRNITVMSGETEEEFINWDMM